MKIGNLSLKNNVFLAPMAGITNLPFRILAREFGCSLAFTEMVNANGLTRKTDTSLRYLDTSPEDKPLGAQIFGSDPFLVADAARVIADRDADLIDINMGCPVKKVVKTGAGAALMKNPSQVKLMLQEVRRATTLPLSIKMRSGWNQHNINALDIARIAEDCGIDAVIIHPRTAEQGFRESADWSVIKLLKEHLRIPVIGSGDIRSDEDALKMIETSRCDGIMVGRAALGNPMIFKGIISRLDGNHTPFLPTSREREIIVRHHLDMEIRYQGESRGVRNFRKHILWYTKGLPGGSRFRNILAGINDKESMLQELHCFMKSIEESSSGGNCEEGEIRKTTGI